MKNLIFLLLISCSSITNDSEELFSEKRILVNKIADNISHLNSNQKKKLVSLYFNEIYPNDIKKIENILEYQNSENRFNSIMKNSEYNYKEEEVEYSNHIFIKKLSNQDDDAKSFISNYNKFFNSIDTQNKRFLLIDLLFKDKIRNAYIKESYDISSKDLQILYDGIEKSKGTII